MITAHHRPPSGADLVAAAVIPCLFTATTDIGSRPRPTIAPDPSTTDAEDASTDTGHHRPVSERTGSVGPGTANDPLASLAPSAHEAMGARSQARRLRDAEPPEAPVRSLDP